MSTRRPGESSTAGATLGTSWLLYWFVDDLFGTGEEVPNKRNDSIEQWADLNDVEIAVRQASRELHEYILVIPVERAVDLLSDFVRTIGFMQGGNDFVEQNNVSNADTRLNQIIALIEAAGSYLEMTDQ